MKASHRVGALMSVSLLIPALLSAQKQPRVVFVNAVDQAGAPVLNLTAADFEVREGTEKKTVTFAGLANAPMRVVLLMDTSQTAEPYLSNIRAGLASFLDAIPEPHEIGIMSIGRQFRVRLAPTADRAKVKDSLKNFSQDGGGIVFLDGVRETETRFLKKEGVRWPVYFILATDGPEMSGNMQDEEFTRIANDMLARGTTVHAAVIQRTGPTMVHEIAMMLAKNTGGLSESLTSGSALPDKMKAIAARIVSDHQKMSTRYQVEYVSDAKYKGSVDVGVLKEGVRSEISLRRPF